MSDEATPHALMLRDTIVWLREHLAEVEVDTDFDRGYRMGLGFALDTLKIQCDAFGLRDDLGWTEPDVTKRLRKEDG
ncbi:hypothetical protein [Sphingomonas sp. RB1R13]|uniref:hypothetical protein n=1 Tax=Sphingomonas sp. RB1R13 TaxID=3096159 RepID=UPI002FCB0C9A